MYPRTIQKLIDLFAKFPTVGPRTAARFVFYLLKLSKKEIETLISLIHELKNIVKTCKFCFNSFEPPRILLEKSEGELCEICRDVRRDKTLLCIVEKEMDLIPIEKIKKYQGIYFILGGTLSKLKKQDVEKLRSEELLKRIKNPEKFGIPGSQIKEIIIALNPTIEGEATILYLERLLKPLNIKITRLGRGLPAGGELEYAGEETLASALEGRK